MWVGAMARPKLMPSLQEIGLSSISTSSVRAVRLDDEVRLGPSGISALRLLKVDAEMHEEEVQGGNLRPLIICGVCPFSAWNSFGFGFGI
jgi:hypothetical protein